MTQSAGLGIICALTSEAATLAQRVRPNRIHALPGIGAMMLAGMGEENAERAARQLLAAHPTCALISFGVAGALDPALQSGQLLCPQQVLDHQGRRFDTALQQGLWYQSLPQAEQSALITGGTLLGVVDAVASAAKKQQLHQQSGAQAVDMESAAIARVAAEQQRPFMVLRAIIDAAQDDIPEKVINAVDQYGRPGVRLASLLLSPEQLLMLPRLARQSALAHQQLHAIAARLPALATLFRMAGKQPAEQAAQAR